MIFKSRRNTVESILLNGIEIVCKTYGDSTHAKSEYDHLVKLFEYGLKVPKPVELHDHCIMMQYIRGMTLTDYLEGMENGSINDTQDEIIEKLLKWLADFYQTGFVRDDVNLRNFIVCGHEIYGVDFEKLSGGQIEDNIGRMMAFVITYDPPDTVWKREFNNRFLERAAEMFFIDRKMVWVAYADELADMERRRH